MSKTRQIIKMLSVPAFALAVLAAPAAFAATTAAPLPTAPTAPAAVAPATDDAAITVKVKEALAAETSLKGLSITVETKQGVVQLSGVVNAKIEQEKALAAAKKVAGVKSVKDNLILGATSKEAPKE